ncbi:MAG TPA: C1 family peptidase [Pilimelia sp.]|nr:C1 family peptidase [Pilimelia sp.]
MPDPGLRLAEIRQFAARHPWHRGDPGPRPAAVDLGGWLPEPVSDQGLLPLCTAAVTAALARYWAARLAGVDFTPSLLFTYRMSRRLAGRPDRVGSTLAHSLAAWREFGLLPERQWPFRPDRVDVDPPAEALAAAARYRRVRYGRLDGPHLAPRAYLDHVRSCLAWGMPVSVEFPLGPSLVRSFGSGVVAVPAPDEPAVGRHVVLVTGYDDDFPTEDASPGAAPGALRFRNNWGTSWGRDGHGWLPYEFLLRGIARQSWLVVEAPWGGPHPEPPPAGRP